MSRAGAVVWTGAFLALALPALAGDDGGAAPPILAPHGKPVPAGKTERITGRIERDGKGVAARVRLWSLPPMEPRALAEAEASERERRSRTPQFGEVDDPSWWLSREARTKAMRVLAGDAAGEVEGRSDEAGALRVDIPSDANDWLVLATDADGHGVFALSRRRAGAPRDEVALRLPSGGTTMDGLLVHHDGSPARGDAMLVPVPLRFPVEGGIPARRADEKGAVRFARVAEGSYRLRVLSEDGTLSISQSAVVPLTAPWRFVVDEPMRLVRGKVHTPAGDPIGDATVESVVESPERDLVVSVRADAGGQFAISLPKRKVDVTVEAPDCPTRTVAVPADATTIDVVLAKNVGLLGRVVDAASGAPVAGVPVYVVLGNGCVGLDVIPYTATSGEDGRFSIASPASGTVRLFAFGAGVMSEGLADAVRGGFDPLVFDVHDLATAAAGPIELRVVPAGRLEGRVADLDGKPIAKARVSLAQSDPMTGMLCGHGYHRSPIFPFLPDPDSAESAADGRFVVTTLRPALLYRAAISASGYQIGDREIVLEEAGPTSIAITLAPLEASGPPRPVVARVVALDSSKPLAGVALTLESYPEPSRTAVTDAGGSARFDAVPSIAATLKATAPGLIEKRAPVFVDLTRPDAPVEVTLSMSRSLTISGRVVSPDGKPVRDAMVGVSYEGMSFQRATETTSLDGRFVVRDVPPGPVSLWASGELDGTRLRHMQEAEGGAKDVEVRLTVDPTPVPEIRGSGGTARFRVVGPDGRPVARGKFLIIHDGDRTFEMVEPFRDGELEISPVDEGLWSILVFAGEAEGGGARLGPVETPQFPIKSPPKNNLIRMPAGQVVTGRVVTGDGKPVGGVSLFAFDPKSPAKVRRPESARGFSSSRADGTFSIDGLAAGTSSLEVEVPPTFVTPAARDVVPGRDVEVRLASAVRPWITVLDPRGAPVAGALVAVTAEGAEEPLWEYDRTLPRTGPKGRVRLGGLDPSRTYTLRASLPTSGASSREVSRQRWQPADTTLQASPPNTISGRVRSPAGEPLEGVWVALDPTGSSPVSAWGGRTGTRADGTFTTDEVPAGEGTLRFGIGNAGPTGSLRASAPAQDLELTLDPGPTWTIQLDAPTGPTTPTGLRVDMKWTPWREDGQPSAEQPISLSTGWEPTLRFRGLLRDHRYAIYVWIEGMSIVGWVPDLPGTGGTRTLSLVPAGSISGTVRFVDPSDAEGEASVSVEGRGFEQMTIAEKGKFTLPGIPAGRFKVSAQSMIFDVSGKSPMPPEATASASPGDTIELVVPARPR